MTQSQQSNATMTADRSQLSDKELHYLKDFLSWELLAMKKCKDAADQCADPEIRARIEQTGQTHIAHFDTILSLLQ
ncbi:hypothetical protein [Paenibacillus flagellatus]|uniref:Spore coat protein n=1 Tax=Paenibacillus flagellatus TaxID=2211139 RepID=A0A2V5KIS5_9BACL|nr:hypothetical protein [Paenibacillus flagellatus]PYI54430.1 hypothetical protein DLM86_13245 [Paenibacillus flagellatus]